MSNRRRNQAPNRETPPQAPVVMEKYLPHMRAAAEPKQPSGDVFIPAVSAMSDLMNDSPRTVDSNQINLMSNPGSPIRVYSTASGMVSGNGSQIIDQGQLQNIG